jgi:hypothetical protein
MHATTTKYVINVGSLSMGDLALMELSNKLMELISKMPSHPVVQTMDMSWNDVYEEGMVAFCGVVERLSGLAEVRLDGNQIGTAGLEALLRALVSAQPEPPKKKSTSFRRPGSANTNSRPNTPLTLRRNEPVVAPGVALSLRETNLGDDSMPTLASFLRTVPNTKLLNLTALDLTNTYIFDGITALTLGLQQNTTLTTIILNSNMIGDQVW